MGKGITLLPQYKPLYTTDARYILITGGRGSAKSFHVSDFGIKATYDANNKALFTRYTKTSIKDSVMAELERRIDDYAINDTFHITQTEIINKKTNGEIIVKGIKPSSGNQTAALKSLEGVNILVIDEAEELDDEDMFDKISQSIRKKGSRNVIIMIMNPSTKNHWIYRRYFEDTGVDPYFNGRKGNVEYIFTTYKDNIANLSESYLQDIEETKKRRPEKYRHQFLGEWIDKVSGVIFPTWTTGEFPTSVQPIYGMDFGFSVHPTTLIATHIDKSTNTLYLKELVYQPKLSTSQIYELSYRYAGNGLIVADSAEPRLITELEGKGLNITEAEKGQGSVTGGIAMMQDFKIVIDPASLNIIKEFNNYRWLDKGKASPIDDFNHAIDAARYSVMHQLANPNKGKYYVY